MRRPDQDRAAPVEVSAYASSVIAKTAYVFPARS